MAKGVFLVSPRFHDDIRVLRTSPEAIGLWVCSGSYSATFRLDGHVPRVVLSYLTRYKPPTKLANDLVKNGLWHNAEDGWQIEHELGRVKIASPRPFRAPIPPPIRMAVMERDEFTCVECGSVDNLSLDHIYPWSLGGGDTVDNLRVLCRTCNSRKGARVDDVAPDERGRFS